MSNKRINKAYVRYDGSGRVIPGSLILNRFKPKVGNWSETPAYECCNPVPVPPQLGLKLTFQSAFPVVDATDVALWNTQLGSSFTEVIITGLTANLVGSPGFYLAPYCLAETGLVSIIDEINCVSGGSTYCLGYNYPLTTVSLPEAISFAGFSTFASSGTDHTNPITFYLPQCTQLGATVGSNGVFSFVTGKNITLTIYASLMTCNSGNPDGDIQFLQANNTVTIVTT